MSIFDQPGLEFGTFEGDALHETLAPTLSGVVDKLIGSLIPRPAGELSGHSAGAPIEAYVHEVLCGHVGSRCFKPHELLNKAFAARPDLSTYKERLQLLGGPGLGALLSRGVAPTEDWDPSNPFKEKQNDTADSIIVGDDVVNLRGTETILVDAKSHNVEKGSQPPNIMSAKKLAEALHLSVVEESLGATDAFNFDITYIGIEYQPESESLRIVDAKIVSLFKVDEPYVNPNLQIQFDPMTINQDFVGTRSNWARKFMGEFYSLRSEQITDMRNDIEPYAAYS